MEDSTNLTLDCRDGVPSVVELFADFQLIHVVLLIVPIVSWMMTLSFYVINLRHTVKHGHKDTKGNVAVLLTIYPVSSERDGSMRNHVCIAECHNLILNKPLDCCLNFAYLDRGTENLFLLRHDCPH